MKRGASGGDGATELLSIALECIVVCVHRTTDLLSKVHRLLLHLSRLTNDFAKKRQPRNRLRFLRLRSDAVFSSVTEFLISRAKQMFT